MLTGLQTLAIYEASAPAVIDEIAHGRPAQIRALVSRGIRESRALALLAWPDPGSRGTWQCAGEAVRERLPVVVTLADPDTRVRDELGRYMSRGLLGRVRVLREGLRVGLVLGPQPEGLLTMRSADRSALAGDACAPGDFARICAALAEAGWRVEDCTPARGSRYAELGSRGCCGPSGLDAARPAPILAGLCASPATSPPSCRPPRSRSAWRSAPSTFSASRPASASSAGCSPAPRASAWRPMRS